MATTWHAIFSSGRSKDTSSMQLTKKPSTTEVDGLEKHLAGLLGIDESLVIMTNLFPTEDE